ncbi:MAG: chromosome segregation protein SMC [Gemmatimonadaceae bacterium]
MRLTKLELHGFKSFADRTALTFEPGVTAIVGPNGCGKSNVSDAIRWVLGEQRARMMRGAKMEEVIFQGSSARRAVSLAEVALHFDNEDGALPVPYKEVVITRRLSRSGESDYFLNGSSCRLRDIHDILRGTGLGSDAGVVIESRMIDALLSDRPDDRRELFEEAAGVGLYRDRRRTTERRLEETAVDLQRLDDLIAEVQSQVRSLARQRGRAVRHGEISSRRYVVEIALAAREMAAWGDELSRLELRMTDVRDAVPVTEEAVHAAEQSRDATHAARSLAEARRGELARLVALQREHVMQLQGEIAVAEERHRNGEARRRRAEEERREGEHHGERLRTQVIDAGEDRAARERLLADSTTALQLRARGEDEGRRDVGVARAELQTVEAAAREAHERFHRGRLDADAIERERAEVAQREAALEGEREQLADRAASTRRALAEGRDAAAMARERAVSDAEAAGEARAAAATARERESLARAELRRTEEEATSLQGRVDALEGLERERVGLAPAAARLLKERDAFGDGAVLGPLSDFINADQQAALVVERFLGPTVHAVLVRDRRVADAVRAWHAAAHPGPLLLLPVDAIDDEAPLPTAVPHGVSALVDATGFARGWVRALLGKVESLHEGTAFVDARGAVWLPGTAGGPGPLRRRAELAGLARDLTQTIAQRDAAARAAAAARVQLAEADAATIRAEEAATISERDVRRADEQVTELDRRLQRAERELADADALATRLATRREDLATRASKLADEARALTSEIAEREAALARARTIVAAAERRLDEAREERSRAQVAQAQAQAGLAVASDREVRLVQEATAASARLDALRSELSGLNEADSALGGQMDVWHLDLTARMATLSEGEARLAEAEAAVVSANDEATAAEHRLDEARHVATSRAEELRHTEVRFTELAGRRTAIRERLEAEWRKPLDEMLGEATALEEDDERLRSEADTLRHQLEQLGPVNVLAIEEHEETVKRLELLSSQRADLSDAKHSLLQAIREIDGTARDLFLSTFTQVRENFRQIFMTLFGGGECDLRLENPEAPLDCDIEIHASPRGKRTQRIHLLSSGERALVALSLLFGIFLTKPSPFCLLDEVDAPLDDANIGRFVKMLCQFKDRTQFIVITHNPRTTTEGADAVYGITMQEPGISSLVSVRMRGPAVDDGWTTPATDTVRERVIESIAERGADTAPAGA